MGPIGYAVAYRTLPRTDGPVPGPPVRRRGLLARITLLVLPVLLVVLGVVASVDGDWWLGVPLLLAAVAVARSLVLGRPAPPT